MPWRDGPSIPVGVKSRGNRLTAPVQWAIENDRGCEGSLPLAMLRLGFAASAGEQTTMLRDCLVGLALAAAGGQARAGWADGMFDELSRDFGSVPRGQVLSHPFRLVNNPKETVTIS